MESAEDSESWTMAVLWGKAYKLARSQFPDVYGLVCAMVWCKFVVREAWSGQVECTEEGEVKATLDQLIKTGQCVPSVTLHPADDEARSATRAHLKTHETVWLSRTDPETDACHHALRVQKVRGNIIHFHPGAAYPDDAEDGTWRLDVGVNETQLGIQLDCIKKFAQNLTSPL